MIKKALSKQEKEWQRQDDAHILRRYAEISADPERIKVAMELLEEEAKNLNSILNHNRALGII